MSGEHTRTESDGSYQLDVKLSDHLHLQVDDVSVTGVPEEKMEKHQHQQFFTRVIRHFVVKPLKKGSKVKDRPEVLQSLVDHVLDEVDLQGGERSSSCLSNHFCDVLGERGGNRRRQSWT